MSQISGPQVFESVEKFEHDILSSGLPPDSLVLLRNSYWEFHVIAHALAHSPTINVMWVVAIAHRCSRIHETNEFRCNHMRRMAECIVTYDEAIGLLSSPDRIQPPVQVVLFEGAAAPHNRAKVRHVRDMLKGTKAAFIETRARANSKAKR